MKKLVLSTLLSVGILSADVNLITDRSDFHTKWLVEDFTKDTGIKVNVLHTEKGLVDRASKENDVVVFSKDALKLEKLSQIGVLVDTNVSTDLYSTSKYIITSARSRGFYVKKGTKEPMSYSELIKPEYKGKLCIRKFTHNYNLVLFAHLYEKYGEDNTKQYINSLKDNLARTPKSNDRGQVKGIYDGECEVSIGNSYYLGLMLRDSEQVKWADKVNFVTPEDVVLLYSGIGTTQLTEDNKRFLEYVSSLDVQTKINKNDFEYVNVKEIYIDLSKILENKEKVYKLIK